MNRGKRSWSDEVKMSMHRKDLDWCFCAADECNAGYRSSFFCVDREAAKARARACALHERTGRLLVLLVGWYVLIAQLAGTI